LARSGLRDRWKQVQVADGVARSDAEKNEKENAPAGTEAFVSEEDAVKEAPLWIVLRCRSREVVTGQSGCVGLGEFLIVQEISSSLERTAIHMLRQIKPEGALQSMLAVQMIGVHNSAVKFLIRATDEDQTFEGTDERGGVTNIS
jgi:hypothetical protein